MRVLVVILNYRSADLTVDCLRSLAPELGSISGGVRAIAVDNASGDQSAEKLQATRIENDWCDWLTILPLPRNDGYAAGNNAAVRMGLDSVVQPDYFWILNPDTVVHSESMRALVEFMDEHPEAGIGGSRLVDRNGKLQCSAHRDPSIWSEFDSGARSAVFGKRLGRLISPPAQDVKHACDWVSGSSMMVRRQVFETIGLMDEGYFLYFDEVDFCRRTRDAGWSCWYVPESVVTHLEGSTTGIRVAKRRPAYWYDSRRRFFIKSYGVFGLIAADALWVCGRMTFWARRLAGLAKPALGEPLHYARDMLVNDAKSVFSGRAYRIRRESERT